MNSSDPATEPSAKTRGNSRRGLLVAAAAIIVAAIVVGALLVVWPPPPEKPRLTASLQPDIAVLSGGHTVALEVSARLGDAPIPPSEYECEWHMNPYDLGTIDRWSGYYLANSSTDGKINFTAGRNIVAGNVTCVVTYQGEEVTAVANITVGPPELEASITPSETQVLVGQNTTFALMVSNSLGDTNLIYTADWSVHGLNSSDYQLNRTSGESVKFMSKTVANATLNALVRSGTDNLSCDARIEVISVPPRSVDYRWYDMFNVPFGEWWQERVAIKSPNPHEREWFTTSYPYLLQWPMYSRGVDTYCGMRLNITGHNLAEINMNERPEFLPFLGTERGGNAVIDWYMQYLTSDEIVTRYPSLAGANDGWFVVLNGTVTLDKQGALSVLGLMDEDFVDFSGWWHAASSEKSAKYLDWLIKEAKPPRLDIWPMYQWPLTPLHWILDAEKVGDKIVLKYDFVSWGMEALMTRWLHEAFLSTEWWFEDMRFHARIGPCLTDIDIDAAVQYAVKASNSTQSGQQCWMWEGMLQYIVPIDSHPRPMIPSPYYEINERYMDMGSWVLPKDPMPGGLPIEYTPGSFNLTAGERLRFEWPSGDVKFMTQPFVANWTNFSAGIALGYSEPNQTDMPAGLYDLNLTARYLEFVGPFDFWTWSRDQTDHAYLADKWQLFGLQPYGMPYLEFWPIP